jgi:hypothetical protein
MSEGYLEVRICNEYGIRDPHIETVCMKIMRIDRTPGKSRSVPRSADLARKTWSRVCRRPRSPALRIATCERPVRVRFRARTSRPRPIPPLGYTQFPSRRCGLSGPDPWEQGTPRNVSQSESGADPRTDAESRHPSRDRDRRGFSVSSLPQSALRLQTLSRYLAGSLFFNVASLRRGPYALSSGSVCFSAPLTQASRKFRFDVRRSSAWRRVLTCFRHGGGPVSSGESVRPTLCGGRSGRSSRQETDPGTHLRRVCVYIYVW